MKGPRKICKLSFQYWPYAVSIVVYTLNRPCRCSVEDKSPFELWCGQQQNLDHLRVFGTVFFVHVPSEKCRVVFYDEEGKKLVVLPTGHQEGNQKSLLPVAENDRFESWISILKLNKILNNDKIAII
uniref:Uncharacterized protein n=1 Tax=Megaselia scalaris TaxID=36166 RepID=T1GM64_MEGSC